MSPDRTTMLAAEFARVLRREAFVARHYNAVVYKKEKRAATVARIPDWAQRRAFAAAVKARVRGDFDAFLARFQAQATARGATLWHAADAAAANARVLEIARRHGVTQIVKSKSMTTEECGLNTFLEAHGITVTDTDLGERIVQLFGEPPSHIVTPAIHRSRQEIGELFARHGLCGQGEDDPTRLTHAARRSLRALFLGAELGITGANFLVAETGTVVVIENEANSLLGTSLPRVHIVVAGIDKLIDRQDDLAKFLTVLAPSSTGQRLTTYTTHYTGPQPASAAERAGGLGDHELHVILLDNGRRGLIGTPAEEALACIRCGACLNVCPVYRRVGGHAYDWIYPGPIGKVLGPGLGARDALPKASSLCGACSEVCPVGIDLAAHIHEWRGRLRSEQRLPRSLPPGLGALLARPRLYRLALRTARRLAPLAGRVLRRSAAVKAWTAGGARRLPEIPRETFRDWWRRRGREGGSSDTVGGTAGGATGREPERARAMARGAGPSATASDDTAREDFEAMFREGLAEAGGEFARLSALPPALVAELPAELPATARAREVLARAGLATCDAPVTKAAVDGVPWLVATARRRLAWSGSLWVDFADLESRAQLLLPENLILLVPSAEIVRDLDAHYATFDRVRDGAEWPSCGTLVTGPSKTADIEQALVFGAHGPRRLLVVVW